jgi:hypothetical protein
MFDKKRLKKELRKQHKMRHLPEDIMVDLSHEESDYMGGTEKDEELSDMMGNIELGSQFQSEESKQE